MAGQNENNANGDEAMSDDQIEPTETAQNAEADQNLSEEYDFLDSKLDELNLALDFLEQKNDDIHEKLKELLKSNIDIREQMRNDQKENK